MNNNDILNGLYRDGESYQPSYRLDPLAIENSLNDVNRKSNKSIISACVTLGLVCVTITVALFAGNILKPATTPVNPTPTDTTINVNAYEEIYKAVNSIKEKNELSNYYYYSNEEIISNENSDSFLGSANTGNSASGSNSSANSDLEMHKDYANDTSDYSETNVQVEGVDEADVVKTDGNYIYSVSRTKINISKANDGKTEIISTINTHNEITEIFLHKDKIVAICEEYKVSAIEKGTTYEEMFFESNDHYCTSAITYDLTNIAEPKEISNLSLEGSYISSRKIDNVIYLTTSHDIYEYEEIDEDKPETYCPVYSVNNKAKCIEPDNITISDCESSILYTNIASINLDNTDKFSDICSVLGGGYDIYASQNNIYITGCKYDSKNRVDTTEILRFSINGTEIEENGRTTVNGEILNQFSMDEHNGYFRIVTNTVSFNDGNSSTALYVLDENLKLVGKTDDVAKDENVKSVRFNGDIAYFVTFRQTDPLFAVDLSDPENPTILSELKIPGFSEYMHVMSDDLLLGFGRDADPITGIQKGFKLSMFDTSDKTEVKEIATTNFGDSDFYSEAEFNHKAIYVDEKNLIVGIPYSIDNRYVYNSKNDSYELKEYYFYIIFKYDKDKKDFVVIQEMEIPTPSENYYGYLNYTRGLRISDYFHIVTNDSIASYNYSDFEKISELKFE